MVRSGIAEEPGAPGAADLFGQRWHYDTMLAAGPGEDGKTPAWSA